MIAPLWRILVLWRHRALWLLFGIVVSLSALATGVALMSVSGGLIAAAVAGLAVAAPMVLRWLGVGRVLLRYVERLVTHAATFRALADLRVWFFRGLAERTAGGLGFHHAGDVLSRLVNDVEALDGLYLRILVPLAGAAALVPALALIIGRHEPHVAVVVVLLFLASAFGLPLFAARAAEHLGTALAEETAGLRVAVLDGLSGLREVRAFGAEGRMLAQVQAKEAALFVSQGHVSRRGGLAQAVSFLFAQAGILTVLVVAGAGPTETVIAAFLVVAAFEAVGGLPRAGLIAGHAAAAARRVLAQAEGPLPLPDPVNPAALPRGFALRFEKVFFRWSFDRPALFEGLDLELPERSRVAILGSSGAGKSTLAALALKVVAPQAGRVLLDEVDLASLAAEAVRSRFSWLSQNTHLFADTIRANLLLAQPQAEETALWAALDQAQIGEFVRKLPEGLDAWVGEGGASFSGGQGRRLALARALLSPAPILILDEPCAGLDAETERAFLATLNEVALDRTVLLITHRLMGVERLTRIYRLSAGKALSAAG